MKNKFIRFTKILSALLAAVTVTSCASETAVLTSPSGVQIPAHPKEETVVKDEPGEETVTFTSGTYFSGSERPAVVNDKQYLPETPIESPQEGKIVYTVNNEKAGKLTGITVQDAGGSSGLVQAIPNLGYKFVKWSDGVTKMLRSGDSEEGVYTAIFDYDVLDMPIMTIDTKNGRDVTSKTLYAGATFSILGCAEDFEITAEQMEIRGRGNNSWGYPKKSYKFKLSKKDNLLGIAAGDERVWCLLANQCDMSLQRNHIAFELGRYFDGIDWMPASTSVEVYLNGNYNGVYLLVEDIQISDNRVDIDDTHKNEVDTGYLLEMSTYASGEVIYAHNRTYMIHNDLSSDREIKKAQKAFIQEYINDCYNALKEGDKEKCEELMDLDSLVAIYLVEEITKNLDSQWDSFNVYKDAGGKLVFGPVWDFDLSLGNADEGAEKYEDIFVGNGNGSGGGSDTWFAVAMMNEWFRQMVADKWTEIYDSISLIPQFIIDESQLGLSSYSRNFEKWKIFGQKQNRETWNVTSLKNYWQHYNYLAEWAENRIEWLNNAFTNPDFVTAGYGIPRVQWAAYETAGKFGNKLSQKLDDDYSSLVEHIDQSTVKGPDGFSGEGVNNLFDDDKGTKYCIDADNIEVTFEMPRAQIVRAYLLRTANDTQENPTRNPDSWKFYGSNDNKEWTLISEIDGDANNMMPVNQIWYGFAVDDPVEYTYYKFVFKNGDGTMQLSEIRLLGFDQ